MSERRATGNFSAMHFAVSKRAQQMQAIALKHIQQDYASEPGDVDLAAPSWETFVANLERTKDDPIARRAFEAQLSEQLLPMIDQILQGGGTDGAQ